MLPWLLLDTKNGPKQHKKLTTTAPAPTDAPAPIAAPAPTPAPVLHLPFLSVSLNLTSMAELHGHAGAK